MSELTADPERDVIGNGEWAHCELADQLEMRGYGVEPDPDDNERSEVWFGSELVGEIRGDNPARVTSFV
jgi:hypothetical protein